MSRQDKARFTVMLGLKPREPERNVATDIGHYFEQGALDRHASLQAARAATLALNDELVVLGVTVDPATGIVTLKRA